MEIALMDGGNGLVSLEDLCKVGLAEQFGLLALQDLCELFLEHLYDVGEECWRENAFPLLNDEGIQLIDHGEL